MTPIKIKNSSNKEFLLLLMIPKKNFSNVKLKLLLMTLQVSSKVFLFTD